MSRSTVKSSSCTKHHRNNYKESNCPKINNNRSMSTEEFVSNTASTNFVTNDVETTISDTN